MRTSGFSCAAEKLPNGVRGKVFAMSDFIREISLIGQDKFDKLANASVAVFGLGGVGSYVAEALARAGVGKLLICDNDAIAPHNVNRQLFALHSTVGKKKTEVAKDRLKDINPSIIIDARDCYYDALTKSLFDLSEFDYVADCIDSVTSKLLLVERAHGAGVPIISCMGTGNKLYQQFFVSDIYKTEACPLAKVMRRELKKRGIPSLKVVFSKELPRKPLVEIESNKRQTPSSISFVPPTAGFILAGEIVRDIIGDL